MGDPILLVGETGTGKTSVIQALAAATGSRLLVYNLNVQTDSGDLLGGYKPMRLKQMALPLYNRFEGLFLEVFPLSGNNSTGMGGSSSYLAAVKASLHGEHWARFIGGIMKPVLQVLRSEAVEGGGSIKKGIPALLEESKRLWETLSLDMKQFERQYASIRSPQFVGSSQAPSPPPQHNSMAFSFMEGILIDALRSGAWILLDEINLAGGEMLQRLAGLLDGGSIVLTEKGDSAPVPRHPSFRLFAAMNPATDFGKKDLPAGLRNRFCEIWVGEVEDPRDLAAIVTSHVSGWPLHNVGGAGGVLDATALVNCLVKIYLDARALSAPITGVLRDGATSRPRYSLRTLTRALHSARVLIVNGGFPPLRAVYEGLSMAFLTQLEASSGAALGARIVAALTPLVGPARITGSAVAGSGVSKNQQRRERAKGKRGADERDNTDSISLSSSIAAVSGSIAVGLSSCDSEAFLDPAALVFGEVPPVRTGEKGEDEESAGSVIFKTRIRVMGFPLPCGPLPPCDYSTLHPPRFVLTPSCQRNLRNLARAVLCSRSPVLLQGPTSAGKTSMVEYLAAATGHVCVRINNHEHTDMSEYLGSYITEASTGKLVFSEGLLVKALREGSWLILDELNLAPSEVLEALNRLLDDNRELYIAETQETVRPAPTFALFATQNPAGLYGGRKPLSQALRNRFVELHVEDIPPSELVTILTARSRLPHSFAQRMVAVMGELQRLRASSHVFAGKDGFITPRDLLRWAARKPTTYAELAEEGYMLLGERLKDETERVSVKEALERSLKVSLDVEAMYDAPFSQALLTVAASKPLSVEFLKKEDDGDGKKEEKSRSGKKAKGSGGPVAIEAFGVKNSVPASSTNDGDGGGTSEFESGSEESKRKAFDARIQSRLSAFLGKLGRGGATTTMEEGEESSNADLSPGSIPGTEGLGSITLTRALRRVFKLLSRCIACDEAVLLVGPTGTGKTTVVQLFALLLARPLTVLNCHAHTETADILGSQRPSRGSSGGSGRANGGNGVGLFEWVDGPLVKSMIGGGFFLLDEASLAEDAVLERLNSVLEPGRSLTLAEKGGDTEGSQIRASPDFRIFATMNPGGDFGKRDLSPALRNRFTEIWVPALDDVGDLELIIASKAAEVSQRMGLTSSLALCNSNPPSLSASHPLASFVTPMLHFISWFDGLCSAGSNGSTSSPPVKSQGAKPVRFTLRDLHAWLGFMGCVLGKSGQIHNQKGYANMTPWEVYAHGACIVLLDGLGLGTGMTQASSASLRASAGEFIIGQAPEGEERRKVKAILGEVGGTGDDRENGEGVEVHFNTKLGFFGVSPFFIPFGTSIPPSSPNFSLKAPTARRNMLRVLRGMQYGSKPILLEGSPGVGKTSLVEALAKASGNNLVRINLSDQSDLADLFGQDLPMPPQPQSQSQEELLGSTKDDSAPAFRWCDGVFLAALKSGAWVLLDELNLAPQAVLEGLNSVLDHRGVCYIPELDLTFTPPPSFRVFATQNPLVQGGGRRGLPRSFLNRFVKVFLDPLGREDQLSIAASLFPSLNTPLLPPPLSGAAAGAPTTTPPPTTLSLMVDFNIALQEDTSTMRGQSAYGSEGGPWDFNLRDLFRWAELTQKSAALGPPWSPHAHLDAVYLQRLRKATDRVGCYSRYLQLWWSLCGRESLENTGDSKDSPLEQETVATNFYGDAVDFLLSPPLPSITLSRTTSWVSIGDECLPRSPLPGVWTPRLDRPSSTDVHVDERERVLYSLVMGGGESHHHTSSYCTRGACVARSLKEGVWGDEQQNWGALPFSLHRPLYHVARSVSACWPVLLVGPPSSGKTTLVSSLASAVGARLRHISLTPSTDATELLGCFEQRGGGGGCGGDEFSHDSFNLLFDSVYGMALGLSFIFSRSPSPANGDSSLEAQLVLKSSLSAASSKKQERDFFTAPVPLLHSILSACTSLTHFLPGLSPPLSPTLIETFCGSLEKLSVSAFSHFPPPTATNSGLASTTENSGSKSSSNHEMGGSRFVWVDGTLVEAMERGEWVIVEDVNLCAPAVVDRLNPLLERNGELLIAECGPDPITGAPRRIKPHPSFRIFFTLNPLHGEVSRALRNRCLEIALPDPAIVLPMPFSPTPLADHRELVVSSSSEALQCKIFEVDSLAELSQRGGAGAALKLALDGVRDSLSAPFRPTTIDLALVAQGAAKIREESSLSSLLALISMHKQMAGGRPRALQYFCELLSNVPTPPVFPPVVSTGLTAFMDVSENNSPPLTNTPLHFTLSALSVAYPGKGTNEIVVERSKEDKKGGSSPKGGAFISAIATDICSRVLCRGGGASSSLGRPPAPRSPLNYTTFSDKWVPSLPLLLSSPYDPEAFQSLHALCDSQLVSITPPSPVSWSIGALEILFSGAPGDGTGIKSRCSAALASMLSSSSCCDALQKNLPNLQGAFEGILACYESSTSSSNYSSVITHRLSPTLRSLLPLVPIGFPVGGSLVEAASNKQMGVATLDTASSLWSRIAPQGAEHRESLVNARKHLSLCSKLALFWGWIEGGVGEELGNPTGETSTVQMSLLAASLSLAYRRGWSPTRKGPPVVFETTSVAAARASSLEEKSTPSIKKNEGRQFFNLLSSESVLPTRELEAVSETASYIPCLWRIRDVLVYESSVWNVSMESLSESLMALIFHLSNVWISLTLSASGGRYVSSVKLREVPIEPPPWGRKCKGAEAPSVAAVYPLLPTALGRDVNDFSHFLSVSTILWRRVVKATQVAWSFLFPSASASQAESSLMALFRQTDAYFLQGGG